MLVAVVLLSACKKEEDREKFLGTYNVIEKEYGYEDIAYTMSISKSSSNVNEVVVTGIFGWLPFQVTCYATINGNSINIPQQTYNSISFTGSGRIDGITLDLSASYSYGGTAAVTITGKKL